MDERQDDYSLGRIVDSRPEDAAPNAAGKKEIIADYVELKSE